MITTATIVVLALIFSAFFSGMEIAFVTSNKLKLEIEKKQSRSFDYVVSIFIKHPGQYITTILVGNNIALVIYSLYMSLLLQSATSSLGFEWLSGSIIMETIISTIVIIFTAEFMPKAVVKLNPNFYLNALYIPVYLFYLLLYPISKLTTWISLAMLKISGLPINNNHSIKTFDKVDLEHLLEEAAENESQNENENELKLFQNALDFSDLRVRDCMVPRVDIEAVEENCSVSEIAERFVETQYARIFVYSGSIDNIIGYVNSKSLFKMPSTIKDVLIPVKYVTETMPTQKLLGDFIKRKSSVAVVIDEFGGTAGMISIEDILEEIFGEIEDEHDSHDMVEKVVGDNEYVLSCRLEVEYLNDKYNLEIEESDEYDTLAGYIIFHYEGIPSSGEIITISNKEIKILRMSSSKLDLARVKIL